MILIFCISNLFIPATLSIINENHTGKIFIYTDQKGIYDFFGSVKFNNVTLYLREDISLKINIIELRSFFKKRTELLNYLQKKQINEIYFFHNAFGSVENWLLKKLSKQSTIFHCPVLKSLPFKSNVSIKALIVSIFSKIIHDTEVVPLWTGERYIYTISKIYLKKISAIQKEIQIDENANNLLIYKNLNISTNSNIILLTGSIIELGQVDKSEYEIKINNLINAIGEKQIIAKPHPRFPNRYAKEKDLDFIPAFIPANVLLTKFKIFIGYSSTVLIEASNKGLVSISLIDYLNPSNSERSKNYKNYLMDNLTSGKIYFPKNLEDIINILNNNKKS